jgi:hypothetical protein
MGLFADRYLEGQTESVVTQNKSSSMRTSRKLNANSTKRLKLERREVAGHIRKRLFPHRASEP